jgi:hypothetical protein
VSELPQVLAMGSGSLEAPAGASLGHSSFVSHPAERDGTSREIRGSRTHAARGACDLVARLNDIPLWLAQGIAADVGLSEALRAERRNRLPAGLERRKNWLTLTGYMIEKEERQ